jgi:hypothetical protein
MKPIEIDEEEEEESIDERSDIQKFEEDILLDLDEIDGKDPIFDTSELTLFPQDVF